MKKLKAMYCEKCGCDRTIMIKNPIIIETIDENNRYTAKLKSLCIPCFLRAMNVTVNDGDLPINIFKCVGQ